MSRTETPEPEGERTYFERIEEAFIRLRGAPLLLSPADWQVADQWRRERVPVELVLAALEEVFAARRARGAEGRVNSLRYLQGAVEEAIAERAELAASGARRPAVALDLEKLTAELAAELPADLPESAAWQERIRALHGPVEEAESRLAEIDRQLLDRLHEALDPDERSEIAAELERSVSKLDEAVSAADRDRVRRRVRDRLLRRRWRLPPLTLFR